MRLGWLASLPLGVAALASSAPTHAATLEIVVENVRDAAGHVLAAVCTEADFLSSHCAWGGRAVAHPGVVIVQVKDVPPGTYAVQVFQDANDNMKVDRSLFGIPEEGMGFSNDARFRFGPPRFAEAAIALPAAGARIVVRLRYF